MRHAWFDTVSACFSTRHSFVLPESVGSVPSNASIHMTKHLSLPSCPCGWCAIRRSRCFHGKMTLESKCIYRVPNRELYSLVYKTTQASTLFGRNVKVQSLLFDHRHTNGLYPHLGNSGVLKLTAITAAHGTRALPSSNTQPHPALSRWPN